MELNIFNFVGIPWVLGGRSLKGLDCAGLCIFGSAQLFGKKIPDNWGDYTICDYQEYTFTAFNQLKAIAATIEIPEKGDIVAIKLKKIIHFGLCCSSDSMLHTAEAIGCKYRRIPIASSRLGVYFFRFQ